MTEEMKVSLDEIQQLVKTTKEHTETLYGAVEDMRGQIANVIDGGYWIGDDASYFKKYMLQDMGKAWSTAKWLERIAAELEAYVQKTLESATTRAEQIQSEME